MTKLDFIDAITQCYSALGKQISDSTIALFCRVLETSNVSYDDACNGLMLHMSDPDQGMFAPTPAHIVRMIRPANVEDYEAARAFGIVWEAIATCGHHRSPVFEDPRISHCIRAMGGWLSLCDVRTDQQGVLRGQFTRAFKGIPSDVKPVALDSTSGQAKMIGNANASHLPSIETGAKKAAITSLAKAKRIDSEPDMMGK